MIQITEEQRLAQNAAVQKRLKELNRGCGSCTACCTLMAVDMAPLPGPSKPARKPCQHLCKRGCGVYEAKPNACSDFICGWLATQLSDDNRMPKQWRPDRLGAIVDVNEVGTITVHLEKDDVWQRPGQLQTLIAYLAKHGLPPILGQGPVILNRPNGKHLGVRSDGTVVPLVSIGVDERGLHTYRTAFPWEVVDEG